MPSNELSKGTDVSQPPLEFDCWQPNFDEEWAETKAYLEARSYMKAPRRVRLVVIGAGASSIAFAREVNEGRIENAQLVVYEKNGGIAGTWFENTYAGCACDIPSHNYQYTWAPNPDWPEYYSNATDIRKYFEAVVKKYDLGKFIKLEHEVIRAEWNGETFKWQVTIKALKTGEVFEDTGDVLVNGGGIVKYHNFNTDPKHVFANQSRHSHWKWPSIPGLETFQGQIMHTAAWDKEYDFKDKNVVVIGNGSSGVQVTAALGKVVDRMAVVMRSPTWVTAPFAPAFAGPDGSNFAYSEEQKKEWRQNPEAYLQYRKTVEAELCKRSALFMKGSEEQRQARDYSYGQMTKALTKKPELIKKLIPSFDVGCRSCSTDFIRGPTPGNGYLETLTQSNVEVSWGAPKCITPTSIVLHDGTEVQPDAIVCATGFDLSYRPRFPIIGENGIDLRDYWTPNAKAYMSLAIPNFPNYFQYLGPATAAAHGSLIPPIEQLTNYFVKAINKLQRENYVAFEPLQRCVDDLYDQHQAFLKHTVWSSHCTSTFKNGTRTGKVNLLHGGSRLHYFEMMQDPRWEDYRWTVRPGGRLYEYFGSGRSKLEGNGLAATWYMDNPDSQLL